VSKLLELCKTAKLNISLVEESVQLSDERLPEQLNELDFCLQSLHAQMNTLKNNLLSQEIADNCDIQQDGTKDQEETDHEITTPSSKQTIPTFFTTRQTDFKKVLEIITYDQENSCPIIPITPFLDACTEYTIFFDVANLGTLCGNIKTDIQGNVGKIRSNYCKPEYKNAEHLWELVVMEHSRGEHIGSDTTTSALLWLTRAIRTMSLFFQLCCDESGPHAKQVSNAFSAAYQQALMPHHNWIVKQLFLVAVKSLPSYEPLFSSLVNDRHDEDAIEQCRADALKYGNEMNQVANIIKSCFAKKDMVA